MNIKIKSFNISIDTEAVIVLILALLIKSIREYLYNYYICYVFIIFHELSHMLIASICGVETKGINIKLSGLRIELKYKELGKIRWLFIYFAGPISNLIIAKVFHNVEFIRNINIAIALVNMMPIYPLDGYNILELLVGKIEFINKGQLIKKLQIITFIFLGITGMYMFCKSLNPSLLLMIIYAAFMNVCDPNKYNSRLYQKCYKNITKFNKNY